MAGPLIVIFQHVGRAYTTNEGGIYFNTFTCSFRKPLFAPANSYDAVYKWFEPLTGKGAGIIGLFHRTRWPARAREPWWFL